jgi:hypothetical protein
MTKEQKAKELVEQANIILNAVVEAMNSDDMANFERYLDLYNARIATLRKMGVEVSTPRIELDPESLN